MHQCLHKYGRCHVAARAGTILHHVPHVGEKNRGVARYARQSLWALTSGPAHVGCPGFSTGLKAYLLSLQTSQGLMVYWKPTA